MAGDPAQDLIDVGGAVEVLPKHGREAIQGVEHEIEIRPDGLRSVEDEAERLLVVRAAAHVCAQEGGGGTLLLPVPRAALADEVAVHDAQRCGGLQVLPEGRVPLFDNMLREVAVDDTQLTVDERVAVVVAFDDGGLEMPRARQDRAEILRWEPSTLGIGAVEHEKLVAPRGDAALDTEEVRECWAVAVADGVPVVPIVARIHGPLAGLAQAFERDSVAGVRLAHGATERELDLVASRRRGLSEHENDRRHQGIAELNVVGIEPMGADERHAIRQVALEGSAVVDVHELRRDEPPGVAAVLHPGRGEKEEVNVQARKAVDLDTRHPVREGLQAFLVLAL